MNDTCRSMWAVAFRSPGPKDALDAFEPSEWSTDHDLSEPADRNRRDTGRYPMQEPCLVHHAVLADHVVRRWHGEMRRRARDVQSGQALTAASAAAHPG